MCPNRRQPGWRAAHFHPTACMGCSQPSHTATGSQAPLWGWLGCDPQDVGRGAAPGQGWQHAPGTTLWCLASGHITGSWPNAGISVCISIFYLKHCLFLGHFSWGWGFLSTLSGCAETLIPTHRYPCASLKSHLYWHCFLQTSHLWTWETTAQFHVASKEHYPENHLVFCFEDRYSFCFPPS